MEAMKNQGQMEIPAGGIGDIVALSDEDIEQIYGPDDLSQLASLGRGGDTMIAHLTPGELVIPADFLEEPAIKQRLLNFLGEQGVENPERYLVGSDANSINPNTGLPEFLSLSDLNPLKVVKKVFRGVKKIVKGVVNVAKKAARYVLPALLAATPLGAVYGSALGGGLATLIEGGSFKDAVKVGLMSGATGAIGTLATGQNLGKALNPAGRFEAFGKAVSEGGINAFTKPLSLEKAQQRYYKAPAQNAAQPVAQSAPKTTRPLETGQKASSELPYNVPGSTTKPPVNTNISAPTASSELPYNVPGAPVKVPETTSANLVKDQAAKSGGGNFFDKAKKFAQTPVGGALVGAAVPALLSKIGDGEEEVSGAESLLGQKTYRGGYHLPELYPEVYGFDVGREMVFDENLGKYVYPQFQPSTPDMEFDKYGRPIPRSQESQQPEMFAAAGGAVGLQHSRKLSDTSANRFMDIFGSKDSPSLFTDPRRDSYVSRPRYRNPYSQFNSTTFGADGQKYNTVASKPLDQGIQSLVNTNSPSEVVDPFERRSSRSDALNVLPDEATAFQMLKDNPELGGITYRTDDGRKVAIGQRPPRETVSVGFTREPEPVVETPEPQAPQVYDPNIHKPNINMQKAPTTSPSVRAVVTPGPGGTYMGFTRGAAGTTKPLELIKKEAGKGALPGRFSNARLWGYDARGRKIKNYNDGGNTFIGFYNDGGEVFPRRNGAIMPHEGIPNEDSVRAMLMPGEFVMTRDAVRGMGRGDLGKGIKSMYSVMRSLEARDRRMG